MKVWSHKLKENLATQTEGKHINYYRQVICWYTKHNMRSMLWIRRLTV